MRNLFSRPSKKQFEIEPEWKLQLKEIIRDFKDKRLFYLDHSKFATYIDKRYLEVFETEVVAFSKKWIRQQSDNNMAAEKKPGEESHGSTRGLHVQDAEEHAKDVASRILLNADLARVGAKLHDLGHLVFAHEGEHMLTNYLKKHGIAELHHSTLARYILELESIHEKTLERLEKEKGRPLTKRELAKYNKYKLIISDIAASHNGEGFDKEIVANMDKTGEEIDSEFIRSFVIPKSDRKIVAKTPEAAVVRFIDPISYVAKDFRDGVIAGVVDVHDPEYEEMFKKMGVSDEVLSAPFDKKDRIVRAVTYALRDDLERNSRGINGARMSPEMADLMYKLRDMNYKKSVKPRTRKIMDILPQRTEALIDKYSELLLRYDSFRDIKSDGTRKKFLKTMKVKQPRRVQDICERIVELGVKRSVEQEVEDILSGKDTSEPTTRRARLQKDLDRLKQEGEITDEVKSAYIKRILKEIHLTPEESKRQFKRYIKLDNPNASEEQVEALARENKGLRFETIEECLAKFQTALYVGMSTNTYLLDMLENEGLITKEERAGRYVFGGTQTSLDNTMKVQKEVKAEMTKKKEEPDGQDEPEL